MIMKNVLKSFAVVAIAMTALSSCSNEEPFEVRGEGTLQLSASINAEVKPQSRATVDELRNSCKVWISNAKGSVRKYDSFLDVPQDGIKLIAGSYIAEAWAGDSVPASFDARYFKGRQDFQITRGQTTPVEIVCKIANTVVQVNYADNVSDVLTECVMKVEHSQGSLEFSEATANKGYFMMNSRDKNLTWTLSGKTNKGESFSRTGTIENCQAATLYSLNVKYNPTESELGGAYLTIEIDEETIDVPEEIVIVSAPSILGYNFDLAGGIRAEQGAVGRRSIFIAAAVELKAVELSADFFSEKFGIAGNDFEFFGMTSDVAAAVEQGGITYTYTVDETLGTSNMKINFEEILTNSFVNGEYIINVEVTDVNDKTVTAALVITVSDAPVVTGECDVTTVWATRAAISGQVVKEGVVNPVLKYRKYGTVEWMNAETTVDGNNLSANLTGLTPGTTYEYAAATDDFISADIMTFTTETAAQFPNAGFENWYMNGKIQEICTSASDKFWDSGNTGAATMSKNPTMPSTDYVHGGTYSACLHSQFVGVGIIGAFASASIFAGEFIRVDGTNGVLGWGRPWTSRPTKLRGWVRYEPVAVTHESDSYADLKKGDMDQGTIYVALLDNSINLTDNGKTYPVIIKTKPADRQLFDKNASNVIAYGEIVFTEATAGSGLVEFEIPLTYNRTDVKPSFILCTTAASRGGDYFVGGNGTKMWVDDYELVYE